MRLLTLTLSVTVYAVTTVLAAFMAGLALGAGSGARVADRVPRPLAAYALVELGLAATGAVTPAVLFRLPPVYVWLHDRLDGSALAFGAARFGLAAGVLLAPCTLMGATLPLIARAAIARADRVGRGAGALYAANTLGAVLGCVGAGFVLVPRLGLAATSAVAAAVNLAVGLVALALGTTAARTGARAVAAPATAHARLVMLAFGLSGFTALGYEVLWTRALVHYTHNSTYAYSAMLAVFLLGLALGSAARGSARPTCGTRWARSWAPSWQGSGSCRRSACAARSSPWSSGTWWSGRSSPWPRARARARSPRRLPRRRARSRSPWSRRASSPMASRAASARSSSTARRRPAR